MHSVDTARENSMAGGNFGLHSKLNEREKKQASLPITVFGLRLVSNLTYFLILCSTQFHVHVYFF